MKTHNKIKTYMLLLKYKSQLKIVYTRFQNSKDSQKCVHPFLRVDYL